MGQNTIDPAWDAPDDSTWDLTPPRRPGLADVNNAEVQNDADFPPTDRSFFTAAFLNTVAKLAIASHKVLPVSIVTVSSGVLGLFVTPANTVDRSQITVTPVAAGQVDLTWVAGLFPILGAVPTAFGGLMATLAGHSYSFSAKGFVSGGNVGVHVYTNQDTSPTNLDFGLLVF